MTDERTAPWTTRRNPTPSCPARTAQGQGQGVPHDPKEFDVMNPAKMDKPSADETPSKS